MRRPEYECYLDESGTRRDNLKGSGRPATPSRVDRADARQITWASRHRRFPGQQSTVREVSVTASGAVDPGIVARLRLELGERRTLADVLDWGRSQRPPRTIRGLRVAGVLYPPCRWRVGVASAMRPM
jgi:hypothetical protein